ncbi:hypothetical protein OO013_18540 [Mangrovivirga sp. M17]|uniref:Repeat protein (TIGR03806 family) n=1 Tax=Mangrovivirga halotolerans TaxID=2993936 RepID=A0ABT3RWE7_9BACT|nr:SO2930 family diheme c-type cytochrome [Mangrovivirga halotolerans]MCX2745887.1 hypothetical protein [Mangrovivirga halotolerans]
MRTNHFIIILTTILIIGCNKNTDDKVEKTTAIDEPVEVETYGLGKAWLSEYGFFENELSQLKPVENVHPYEINSPLFSDYASKKRFIYLPEGESINYVNEGILNFPSGTILIKNFLYKKIQNSESPKIIETRLLIKNDNEWKPLTYIWKEDQSDAYLEIVGARKPVQFISEDGELMDIKYSIPDLNQCQNCHNKNEVLTPIGPTAGQLNKYVINNGKKVNQLAVLAGNGSLSGLPELKNVPIVAQWDNPGHFSIDQRARAYLDMNCGHCHNPQGSAKTSGLNLTLDEFDEHKLGINKKPVAAGKASGNLLYDIVKGKPEESIIVFRMDSDKPEIMMPELGRSLIHKEGVELIRQWIKNMDE